MSPNSELFPSLGSVRSFPQRLCGWWHGTNPPGPQRRLPQPGAGCDRGLCSAVRGLLCSLGCPCRLSGVLGLNVISVLQFAALQSVGTCSDTGSASVTLILMSFGRIRSSSSKAGADAACWEDNEKL